MTATIFRAKSRPLFRAMTTTISWTKTRTLSRTLTATIFRVKLRTIFRAMTTTISRTKTRTISPSETETVIPGLTGNLLPMSSHRPGTSSSWTIPTRPAPLCTPVTPPCGPSRPPASPSQPSPPSRVPLPWWAPLRGPAGRERCEHAGNNKKGPKCHLRRAPARGR